MTNLIASDQKRLIIGMGQTGLSCARFLVAKGMSFDLCDTRELLPNQAEIEAEFPQCQFFNGKLDADVLRLPNQQLLRRSNTAVVFAEMWISLPNLSLSR